MPGIQPPEYKHNSESSLYSFILRKIDIVTSGGRLSNGLLNKKKKKKNKLAWTCLIKKNFSVNVFFFKFAYSNVFLLGI